MTNLNNVENESTFDPYTKEEALRKESDSWDTSNPEPAIDGDIPVIDLQKLFTTGGKDELIKISAELRQACEEVGFFTIVGHQAPNSLIQDTFALVRRFHQLPIEAKQAILMDQPDWPIGGVGYLPVKNKKLPARNTGNLNEAFIVKQDYRADLQVGMEDNQWPAEDAIPEFREGIEHYARCLEDLGRKLMPIFATALEMPEDFFSNAFIHPMYRLRMTHYPAISSQPDSEYGIAPHVDTTFCTILAQDKPGLTIYNERRKKWIQAPMIENAFIVNSGELLRQWTNDRFVSVKHFANNNTGDTSRYSIPFFLNANADYKMECIASCCGPDNPARYPTISYAESQAVAQGE